MTAMPAGPGQVPGFDYVTGKAVAMTPAEWRDKYRAARRMAEGGETAYYGPAKPALENGPTTRRLAEAYAIIPAWRAK